jgi:hypothetical protein
VARAISASRRSERGAVDNRLGSDERSRQAGFASRRESVPEDHRQIATTRAKLHPASASELFEAEIRLLATDLAALSEGHPTLREDS